MDTLDAAAAAQVASWLLDERDLASVRCTNCFWRDVLANNPGLWSQLAARRFGAAALSAGAAGAGSAAAAAAPDPERRFRQLAGTALRRPVAALERLIWLDGHHLQRIDDPSSPYGTTVRVASVWWLELGGRLHGVLPGRYRLVWRMRMEPGGSLRGLRLSARQEQPGAQGASDADSGEARAAVQHWQWTLDEEGLTHGRALGLAAAAAAQGRPLSAPGALRQAHAWHGWFEVSGEAFEPTELCDLWVELRETHEWKGGIVLDSVRLVRQRAQQGGQPQQAPVTAEAQSAGGRQRVDGGSLLACLRHAARALHLPS